MALVDISLLNLGGINLNQAVSAVYAPGCSAGKLIDNINSKQVFPDALSIPRHDLQDNPDILSLLSWHTGLSDFAGFNDEIAELSRWAKSSNNVSVKFVTGEGGVGKSRLAAEFGIALRQENWAAGFAKFEQPAGYFLYKVGTLLIIDYPEEHLEGVASFLNDLVELEALTPIRVLFLSRQSLDNWRPLIDECRASDIVDHVPIILEALPTGDAYQVFTSTLERAAECWGTTPLPLSEEAFASWARDASENSRPLFVVCAAVHSALNPNDLVVGFSGREVVQGLVRRELQRLRPISKNLGFDKHLLERLIALSAVSARLDESSLRSLARKCPGIGIPTDKDLMGALMPSTLIHEGAVIQSVPDILSACFVVEMIGRSREQGTKWLWVVAERELRTGLTKLGRVIYDAELTLGLDHPKISQNIANLIRGDILLCEKLMPYMVDTRLPHGLHSLDVAVWETLVDSTTSDMAKASYLNNLGYALLEIGDNLEAIKKFRISIIINERECSTFPEFYSKELVLNYLNLSRCYFEKDSIRSALSATNKALSYARRAADFDQKNKPLVASCVANQGKCFALLGKQKLASKKLRNAISIYEEHKNSFGLELNAEHDYFIVQMHLARTLMYLEEYDNAEIAAILSLEFVGKLYNAHPDRFDLDYARAAVTYSDILLGKGDKIKALEYGTISWNYLLPLINLGRVDILNFAIYLSGRLTEMHRERNEYVEASGYLAQLVNIYGRLKKLSPTNARSFRVAVLRLLDQAEDEAGDSPGGEGFKTVIQESRNSLSP